MNELNNYSSSPQERLRFWLRVGLGLRIVPEIWNTVTAFHGSDVPGLMNYVFLACTLVMLWFLAELDNFARRLMLLMGIVKLLFLPFTLKTCNALLSNPFTYLSGVALIAQAWDLFPIGFAFLLLQRDYRALFIKTPPKPASRYVLVATAGIALLAGVIWSLPSTQQRYANWQAHRRAGWHQDAQKLAQIPLPKWGDSQSSRVTEGINVIEFEGPKNSGQRIILLIGDVAKPLPIERVMQSIDSSYVPTVLFSRPVVFGQGMISMVQEVHFPDLRIGDKNGLLVRWYTNDLQLIVLGYAPVEPTFALASRKPFSDGLFGEFLTQLIHLNPLPKSDLGIVALSASANAGDVLAQYHLGIRYWLGRGVPPDELAAVNWFEKAANSGLPQAQYNMGWAYENGAGVPSDLNKAAEWFEKAAYLNHPGAQASLAAHYLQKIVPPDFRKAYFWLTLAKDRLDVAASFCEQNKGKLTPEEISEIEQQAGMIRAIAASSSKKSSLPLVVPEESL